MIGFDNREFARALHPTLTIITQPTEAIAEQAARIILERLETEQPHQNEELYLQTEVMLGKSVKKLLT